MTLANTKETHLDPVCGMTVRPQNAAGTTTHAGKRYYFCSKSCLQRFEAAPEKYLAVAPTLAHMEAPLVQIGAKGPQTQKQAEPVVKGAVYVCPMDPEVRSPVPGACPICGMALEPEVPSADHASSELQEMTRRFWICAALTLPLLVLSMGASQLALSERTNTWSQLFLASPVVLWGGLPFFQRGWTSL